MNDETHDTDLERLIALQPLARPTAKLDERMRALFAEAAMQESTDLPLEPRPLLFARPWFRFVSAVAACLVVALLLWLVMQSDSSVNAPGTPRNIAATNPMHARPNSGDLIDFNPVRIEDSWSAVQPQDVVVVDGDPLRRFHRQTVDRVQLIDEKNNMRIEYTVPRHEVFVMPVKYD